MKMGSEQPWDGNGYAVQTRPVIYQMLPRLFTNYCENCVPNGTISQNGSGKMNAINGYILRAIKELGVTHVWYTGIIEHAQKTDYSAYGIGRDNPHIVKGEAGSPYAIKDYYDVDPDLAESVPDRMSEFEALLERTHKAGLKVLMDFVPNHVARQYVSDAKPEDAPSDLGVGDDTTKFFARDNNFYYLPNQQFSPSVYLGRGADAYVEFPAKATGNDCFSAFPGVNDWYETVKLNYGVDYGDGSRHFVPVPDTWMKMLHILLYWAGKGVDGFRCDMAHMVPIEFWSWCIKMVKSEYPDVIFIAEIYDVGLYHSYIHQGGFDYLYDKVNLYDTLRDIQTHNHSAARITDCWQRLGDMGPHMLNFLENHDEQRYASNEYAGSADTVTPSLVVSATLGRGAVMIYAGQELGEKGADSEGFSGCDGRTTIFDYWSVPTLRRWLNHGRPGNRNLDQLQRWLRERYRKVLTLVNDQRALREGELFDLMYVNMDNPRFNPHRQFAYLRHAAGETILTVVNFDCQAVEVGVRIPAHAFEFLGIPEGRYAATELLGGSEMEVELSSDCEFVCEVRGADAVMWKFKS